MLTFYQKISCWSIISQKEDLKINISPLIVRISSSLPTRTPPQYKDTLFSIKCKYTNNKFYAILAGCWRLGLRFWFNFLGLKLLQCSDSLFFWVLRSYYSICFKVEMFVFVRVSWLLHAVFIHLGQQLNIYGEN